MNKIIALTLVAASLTAFPVATPAFAIETGITGLCGPNAPEGYKRPGGFCEQAGSNKSLVDTKGCQEIIIWSMVSKAKLLDQTVLVADNCYYYDYPVLL